MAKRRSNITSNMDLENEDVSIDTISDDAEMFNEDEIYEVVFDWMDNHGADIIRAEVQKIIKREHSVLTKESELKTPKLLRGNGSANLSMSQHTPK